MADTPIRCGGYFTMLKYVRGLDWRTLERTIGFAPDSLRPGFTVVQLCSDELVGPADFELRASSRWSKGLVGAGTGQDIEQLLAARGPGAADVMALRVKVCAYFARRGDNTPAKVLPLQRPADYPDAHALAPGIRSGVPQFEFRPGITRRFVTVADNRQQQ